MELVPLSGEGANAIKNFHIFFGNPSLKYTQRLNDQCTWVSCGYQEQNQMQPSNSSAASTAFILLQR